MSFGYQPSGTNKAVTFQTGVYIVASGDGKNMSISSTPKIHTDERSARTEAERLANLNPGTAFTVMKVEGTVKSSGIVWK